MQAIFHILPRFPFLWIAYFILLFFNFSPKIVLSKENFLTLLLLNPFFDSSTIFPNWNNSLVPYSFPIGAVNCKLKIRLIIFLYIRIRLAEQRLILMQSILQQSFSQWLLHSSFTSNCILPSIKSNSSCFTFIGSGLLKTLSITSASKTNSESWSRREETLIFLWINSVVLAPRLCQRSFPILAEVG